MTVILNPSLSTTLQLETFTSFDAARAIEPEWNDLVTRLDGSLYATFSWCEVWWRHYGVGRGLFLFAVRRGDELVGLLPLFVDRLRLPIGIGRAKVAKFVGADSTLAVTEPLVDAETATDAFELILRELFETEQVDMLHVACSGALPHLDALRQSATDLGGVVESARDREADSHTVFEMREGFESYMKSLSSHQRSNYRRKLKKLDGAFRFEVDVVHDPMDLESEFASFIEMHQAQWKGIGKLGHFDDWPASRMFSWDLVRTFARTGGVRLVRLLADGHVVAYYWCFTVNRTYYWRLSARLVGAEWDSFALGRVGVVQMMQVAAGEGVTAIEAGVGSYGYKENLNATSYPLYSIVLQRRGIAAWLRARLTLAYADILNLLYYRIWFIRLAPHVGFRSKPLWRSWIRRRF